MSTLIAEPVDYEEYEARCAANSKITGYGMEVAQHLPCPFCAAPGWVTMVIVRLSESHNKDLPCQACGRSAMLVVESTGSSTRLELVQTGGNDPPVWMKTPPRDARVKAV